MVCSACGFENLAGMRFCGMCGMPMPHRPLTTPGAQSTLSLTRVPLEGGVSSPERGTSAASFRTVVSLEMPGADGASSSTETTAPRDASNPATDVIDDGQASTSDLEPTELVPDVPLDEYLRSFQYQPPSEPTESTMRGDESVDGQAVASAGKTTVGRSAPVDVTVPADDIALTAATEAETPLVLAEGPPDTVESRLGLEPEVTAEERLDRPNFLDLSEPPKQVKPAMSGTSTITGPSFLGLNNPPETRADRGLPKPRKLRASHWEAWSAVVLVLVFAGLGVMQYRLRVYHTNNGPVEIVKAKVRDWRQRILARVGSEPAPASAIKTDAKHELRPPRPTQSSNQDERASGDAASGAAPPSSTAETTPVSKPPKLPLTSTTLQPTTAAGGAAAKPAVATSIGNQEAAAKPSSAGAEEMAKAKNASDAAATAAWLWKATAKGNPDAPVQLADMYISGQGVPRSCEQAVVLLKTAAEKENARARNRLASMYATGTCVQRDRVQAYRWLSSALAANPSSDWAKQNRDLIWQQMTPEERTQAEKYR